MSADQKLAELQYELPPAPQAVAVYRPAILVGNLLHTSGHLPLLPDGSMIKGCVGKDADVDAGYQAAKQVGLALLSTVKTQLGTLDRVKRVVKIMGFVNCTADFTAQPSVINGCSELMKDVFGEAAGIGARSAVGVHALPLGVMVEIEAIFEVTQG